MARLQPVIPRGLPLDAAVIRRQPCHRNRITTMKNTLIHCAAIAALTGFALAGGESWTSDFAAAKKQATESKHDLLIDFTGSDWCGWCIKLKDEVFNHDAFKDGVKDRFVLVEIDFPRDKSKLSEEIQSQNKELGEAFAVQGYPTIVLADAEGRPYAYTGYQPGGPEKYLEHLGELQSRKAARDEALEAAGKLDGAEQANALIAALDALQLDEAVIASRYPDLVERIKSADPDDSTGFAGKLAKQKRFADFQGKLQELAEKGEMDGAMALVNKMIDDGGLESEETLQLMMTRVLIHAEQGKLDEAIKALDAAKAFAPESPLMPEIEKFRKQLEESFKQKDNADAGEEG
jgi:thioredoxin-related protein